jgi:hypothetical protein
VLEGPQGVLAMACKPTVRPWFEVAFGGRRLLVEPSSILRRVFLAWLVLVPVRSPTATWACRELDGG